MENQNSLFGSLTRIIIVQMKMVVVGLVKRGSLEIAMMSSLNSDRRCDKLIITRSLIFLFLVYTINWWFHVIQNLIKERFCDFLLFLAILLWSIKNDHGTGNIRLSHSCLCKNVIIDNTWLSVHKQPIHLFGHD